MLVTRDTSAKTDHWNVTDTVCIGVVAGAGFGVASALSVNPLLAER